jgi:hypothetical protein
VYDPGRNTFDTKNGSAHDDSDSGSSSSSNNNVPCNADTYHSFDHDRNKSILTTSDVDLFLPLDSMQITCPVNTPQPASTNPPLICLAGSKYTRTAQCTIPPQHLAHPSDLSDNALAHFSGKAYRFALPADNFSDRKCL